MINTIIILVTVIHIWFFVFEVFLWKSSFAQKFFKVSLDELTATEVLASNQGFYNAFLAGGLILAYQLEPLSSVIIQNYFLGCIVLAGAYGAWSAKNIAIFLIQALPAIIGLGIRWLS